MIDKPLLLIYLKSSINLFRILPTGSKDLVAGGKDS